jgi:hypothetical protein
MNLEKSQKTQQKEKMYFFVRSKQTSEGHVRNLRRSNKVRHAGERRRPKPQAITVHGPLLLMMVTVSQRTALQQQSKSALICCGILPFLKFFL